MFRALLDWRRYFEGASQENPRGISPRNNWNSASRWKNETKQGARKNLYAALCADLIISVLKPTQVDRASSLRGTGEPSLRNSAKKLDVSSQDVFPDT